MPNLPLDANDEDILQRGLRRPSLDDTLLPLNEEFQAVRNQYDNFAPGILSTDNIWPMRNAAELANLSSAERQEYLEQRGLLPPIDSIPFDAPTDGINQLIENVALDTSGIDQLIQESSFSEAITNVNQQLDTALSNGANIPTDSYGQPLVGSVTQPQPLTAPSPGGAYAPPGVQPPNNPSSVYNYTPIDLYDDRYDFATGKIIRKGIATGAKGGVGAEDRPGNTIPPTGLAADTQSEITPPPTNVGPNDTAPEQYDDAILRQARIQEQDTNTMGDPAADVETDNATRNPHPSRTETSPPQVEQASRIDIISSRRRTTQDIRDARSRGVNLVRKRRPDGTYYAAPPSDTSDRRLPQRARDLGF
jgi:hypothetical protein